MPNAKRREQCKSQTTEHTSHLRSLHAIVKSDFSLPRRNPIRPQQSTHTFSRPNKVSIDQRGAEGPAPISANLFCKSSALAIRVSGLVRLALRPFDSSFQLGV